MLRQRTPLLPLVASSLLLGACQGAPEQFRLSPQTPIRAFDIDFNWGPGGPNDFAAPGLWADADPAEHVEWCRQLGANVIQTFCVSCNGYAWYEDGVVPPQPGLKHDFLRDVVELGHARGMSVFGYFCIGSNTRWGQEHPDLSYGIPSSPHIPYTDVYLAYLDGAIRDAVRSTGIDGFMIDWVWMPERQATQGRWLQAEKDLFAQLMGRPFPGEEELTGEDDAAYSRRAIERCWQTIRRAAKETEPGCLIWLSCHSPTHPHVVDSLMFREADWLMNEGGDLGRIEAIRATVGPQTRLITCLAAWNGADPLAIVPAAVAQDIGLYGFTKPQEGSLLPAVNAYLSRPVSSMQGDEKNIAVLARAYRGLALDCVLGQASPEER